MSSRRTISETTGTCARSTINAASTACSALRFCGGMRSIGDASAMMLHYITPRPRASRPARELFCGERWRETEDAVYCVRQREQPQYVDAGPTDRRNFRARLRLFSLSDDANREFRVHAWDELRGDLVIAGGLDRFVELDLVTV